MSDDFKRNVLKAMAHGRALMEANPGRDPMKDVEAASLGEPYDPWKQPTCTDQSCPINSGFGRHPHPWHDVRAELQASLRNGQGRAPDAYWRCDVCGYKQLRTMKCYCEEFEKLRREWAASQNIATKDTP